MQKEHKIKNNKNQEVFPQEFNSILSYIRRAERDVSNRKICSLEKIDRKIFNNSKKKFDLNLVELINYYNSLNSKEKYLIIDYVLIGQDMKIIDRPYNLIRNHSSGKTEPCLVLLFLTLKVEDFLYPVYFDYWISKIMLEEDEPYFTKTNIAQNSIELIIENGLMFDIVLFDAGFCNSKFLNFIDSKGLKYYCRFPKSWNITVNGKDINSKNMFTTDLNGSFYFDRWNGFTKPGFGRFGTHEVQLVVIANTKEKLLNRDFYCILTNDLKKLYTQVIRTYKKRGKIEVFFKNLKSYLGLCSIFRHKQEQITNHINFCLSGYILIEELSKSLKKNIFQTIQYIKIHSKEVGKKLLLPIWERISVCFVNTTSKKICTV